MQHAGTCSDNLWSLQCFGRSLSGESLTKPGFGTNFRISSDSGWAKRAGPYEPFLWTGSSEPDSRAAWHRQRQLCEARLSELEPLVAGIQEFGCWNSGIRVNIQEFKQNSEMASLSRGTK